MSARRTIVSTIGAALVAALVVAGSAGATSAPRVKPATSKAVFQNQWLDVASQATAGPTPPRDGQCRAQIHVPCYSPQEIRHAYGVDRLVNNGDDGAGESIVIIDSFGSPTIQSDLATFDAGYGLPAPPSFRIIHPLGTVPYDPTKIPDQVGWAAETTLDVEWAHAMAPDANIVLMTSPVDETQGVTGMPQFDDLINFALDHHLGNVISESWGTTENNLFTTAGQQVFSHFEKSYARAAAMGVTAIASTGDAGVANATLGTGIYPFPTVNFPASSPLVTAVGGTSLYADTSGDYQSETVWNSDGGAGGGGISQEFGEPFFQQFLPSAVEKELGGARGIPDVSWNADPNTPILVYLSFLPAGYYTIGGTSEGSPSIAGVVADLDQLAGHSLGSLSTTLYGIAGTGHGFHDVTVGNNSLDGITGYSATPGWDLASGWGSPDLAQLFGPIQAMARH
jgi:subtilase family serine protease